MYKCALILAAGKGKRMKSDLPKVLHKVCDKEMVNHVIDTMRKSELQDVNVVIGKGAELVREATSKKNISYSLQSEQLGTGHAVKCAEDFLRGKDGVVAIFTGDAPLITEDTVKNLIDFHEKGGYKATIITALIDNPEGYGRIIRNVDGSVKKIVEHKDCTEDELKVKEINSAMYCFDIKSLLESLDKLNNNNVQGEYYLTDVIGILEEEGAKIGAISVPFEEILGVNSRLQLCQVGKVMQKRINEKHMENGSTLIDPDNTYIGADVEIESDTIIYPGNVLQGKTVIKTGCVLYPNSRIEDSVIGKNVTVQSSVILESKVGEDTTVGPFAYIRPESNIGNKVRIGDFVEIKKSTIGNNTKVSHLTYIGDAEVGEGCNFGCGTVVVNYDGKDKHKTVIGNKSFIGCNTNLVSPVTVEDNTYIAAGSTITNKVPEGSLAIARAKQVVKEGWVDKKGLLK
ncbi:bifunctional UDP-N-acetylglucosamine pyrophosphorylase/glucosamine-1-phosphate N-acetyltransferase [Clostridium acetobutylicum]|uniref:Bifunctional protein GlmU n=1 Tax=Clostridium acetobutylicum (strain ATCC 824 / DSM 792 / JCM 1419 / IAM 19013 / LMG 5710 / NBRC 13948 / NRRL B-527 / VKM B-1787 / 2291 / W) TaxID=272562 RepID=GLMU_CLOAB|nr:MULTISPECIES: bifunctional UDP-N-acetylglucosamine diphosphorylase/glucosamine-1-phosphate N-acetyltransferase GlmU [Clostridium]Q97E92.1 RecName: Full=Bifunctional protein GlmU; Includes: RecName: Full=UDP-N-acetylglucosamine pyrophosphorylase; AltName: Full=N-acetylglucosamine-1-phosphate uridyltransferase; Includes: RecName: Full=Glucosamine-1-phosphate N-acetyltransferase [Clostridium acetobutylicum ATCC 824]AAK81158.1 UDP-N-acetylglucosamine pyrophosphorylase [Clostridium acetobutylicum A